MGSYAGRIDEHTDKPPRQSDFSLGLYGQRWIYGMAIRAAVLWRKSSYGSQSAEGSRFVGRLMTVVTSLRRQQ